MTSCKCRYVYNAAIGSFTASGLSLTRLVNTLSLWWLRHAYLTLLDRCTMYK